MYKSGIDMRVLVNGRSVREYAQKGMTFIESRHGSNYTIRVKNDNAYRVMAVVSVDGLDVITGNPAEKTNKGYIVDAYSATEIKGYRLSDEKSADFLFVSKDGDKNYVAQAEGGDKRNSGVIGIRVFEEKPERVKVIEKTKVIEKHIHHNYPVYPWNPYPVYPVNPQPYWYSTTTYAATGAAHLSGTTTGNSSGGTVGQSNAVFASNTSTVSSAGATYSAGNLTRGLNQNSRCYSKGLAANAVSNAFDSDIHYDSFDTGTGWGKEKLDVVKREVFRRGKVVAELVLYYASTDALLDMGIDLNDAPRIAEVKAPKAFGDSGYCQPPKGWQGNR